jgi:hypothetical protein
MNSPILTLRLSRRALGAAVLTDEVLTFADGRHLSSQRHRADVATTRYVERLLALSKARFVVMDAPQPAQGEENHLVMAVESVLRPRHIAWLVVGRSDLLQAYGLRALRNRAALRDIAWRFWPEMAQLTGKVQPYVADAAIAALYGESRVALHPSPP